MAQAGMPEGERREAEALEAGGQLEPALRRWEAFLLTAPESAEALEAACQLSAKLGHKVRALELLGRLARVSCREDQGWRGLYVARQLSQAPLFLDGAVARVAAVLEGSAEAGGQRPLPLWAPLSREDLPFLVGATRIRTFEAGDAIVEEGAPGTSMYAIAEGRVEVRRAGPRALRGPAGGLEAPAHHRGGGALLPGAGASLHRQRRGAMGGSRAPAPACGGRRVPLACGPGRHRAHPTGQRERRALHAGTRAMPPGAQPRERGGGRPAGDARRSE